MSLHMRTNGYWEIMGPDLQNIIKVLLMLSQTYGKLTTMEEVSLENLTLQLKIKTRFSTQNYMFVCHFEILVGIYSFCNDVNYDEVTKTHNIQLCAQDEGPFNLKILQYANEAH